MGLIDRQGQRAEEINVLKRVSKSPARSRRRGCPPIGALMRYGGRIVRVMAEASGRRAIIESVDEGGRTFRSTVKWANLADLNEQLF